MSPDSLDPARPDSPDPRGGNARPDLEATLRAVQAQFEATRRAPSSGSGNPLVDSRNLPAGRFGRYELLGEIARGGMGVVFRARQIDAQRLVALKVLLAGDFASAEDERRFIREAETAAQLSHPNLVAVYDIGREAGRRFYTMELVDGRPLGEWAKDRPREERLRVFVKASRAVHAAHMKGVIHRDLKPGNILVTPEGEPKVLDFGLAKLARPGADTMSTVTGQTLGTPYWMAPEQAAGRVHDIDIRTDVFALGVVLYQLVADALPFFGLELVEVLRRIQSEEPARFEAPPDLKTVILKALEKERSRRYATAEALAEDVERVLAGEPVTARPPSIGVLGRRWLKRHPAVAAAALAVAATAGLGAAWLLTRPGELRIDARPESAEVEIDGRKVTGVARVPAGRHTVRVSAPGHETEEHEVAVGRGESRTLSWELERSTGSLTVSSGVPATTVETGGQVHGLPLVGHRLTTGDHLLTFRAPGHASIERRVTIARNESAESWVALPPVTVHASRVGNSFMGQGFARDMNGDGVMDASALLTNYLVTLDGRTGQRLSFTTIGGIAAATRACHLDFDGDGVMDDAVLARTRTDLRVFVFSGRELAASGGPTPRQVELASWLIPDPMPGGNLHTLAPVGVGATILIPRLGAVEGFRSGRAGAAFHIEVPGPAPMLASDGESAFVKGESVLMQVEADGRVTWTVDVPGWFVQYHAGERTELERGAPLICTGESGLRAYAPDDGRLLWTAPCEGNVVASSTPRGRPGICLETSAVLRAVSTADGRVRFAIPGAGAAGKGNVFAVAEDAWIALQGENLACRSTETGGVLWSRKFTDVPALSGVARGPLGTEFALATDRRRLVVLGSDGGVRREVELEFVPQLVSAVPLNGDGLPDWVLTGYGLQVVRPTRVLWQRRVENAVRSRPLVIQRDGEAAIVQAARWEGTRTSVACLRGRTGEFLWSFGAVLDVMHEPALAEYDGDGVPDIWTQGDYSKELVCLSGRTGARLAGFPLEATPYPPAVLRDLDGDGDLEAVVFEYGVGLTALAAGAAAPLWRVDPGGVSFFPPHLADLDGDGREDLVAAIATSPGEPGQVVAWSLAGRELWRSRVQDSTWGSPFGMDFDGDGLEEIVVPGREHLCPYTRDGKRLPVLEGIGGSGLPPLRAADGGVFAGTHAGVVRLRRDGSIVWKYVAGTVTGALGLAQLPTTGSTLVGADGRGRVFALDPETGRELWRHEIGARCEFGVTLADVTGDGVVEAVLGADDFTLRVLDLR